MPLRIVTYWAGEYSGLGRMRVHHVRLAGGENRSQLLKRSPVAQRVNLPAQVVCDDDLVAAVAGACQQFAFGAKGRAGHKRHVVSGLVKTFAGENRVFLCSAQDQPGNNVTDVHQVIVLEPPPAVKLFTPINARGFNVY